MLPVIAEIVRSGFVEGHHTGSVVALDADGTVTYSRGDVTSPILPRSCNKPLQAVGMLERAVGLDPDFSANETVEAAKAALHTAKLKGTRHVALAARYQEALY